MYPLSEKNVILRINSIAIFCGSRSGNDPAFLKEAKELGHLLASNKIGIVYGGGSKGLMGAVADSALQAGGHVTGIIPKLLTEWEQQHHNLTELLIVDDMHTRKKMMYEKADAAIILPGGYGTLDELFEMLTWNNLNIHNKPIFLLNTHGFYAHLIAHIMYMEKEGFLYQSPLKRVTVLKSPDDFLNGIDPYPSNKK
jgi:uncharacterized protein (TIGR00730 family)